jgi:eukaryotic-like serine/threonine-protein kinase
MPPERVRDVGLQVLRALAAAHELGIVHRDVKPGNILDAGVGTWKVADFGIAKWVHADETLTGTGELLGSPSYLAPERIDGEQAGPASDLYAVGVLLYESLTGRKPFEGDDPFALAAAIRDGRHEPPTSIDPDADPEISVVIERAMRRDPADRYESAEAMAAALLGEHPGTEAAVTMPIAAPPEPVADAQPDGSETVRMPPMEQTARLPVQPPAARSAASRRLPRVAPIVAGAIVVVVLLVILAFSVFTGRNAPGPGATTSTTLPAPLENALDELEESVQP